jgi:hypothetical protein
MKIVKKTVGSFEAKSHLASLIDHFDTIRNSVNEGVDIKEYISEGRKH